MARLTLPELALSVGDVAARWRALRGRMRAGSVARPGERTFFDPVRGVLGAPEATPAAGVTTEGSGVLLTQTDGATGGRIDMGALEFMAEFTALVRFRVSAGTSGSTYGSLLGRGDGVFGTDSMFAMGFRQGSYEAFLYGRDAGSLLGSEIASPLGAGTPGTMVARWRSGAQRLWLQNVTTDGRYVRSELISASSGNGTDGGQHLWVGGGEDMTDNAGESTPGALVHAFAVFEGYITDDEARALLNDPYGPLRRVRRVIIASTPAGTPVSRAIAVSAESLLTGAATAVVPFESLLGTGTGVSREFVVPAEILSGVRRARATEQELLAHAERSAVVPLSAAGTEDTPPVRINGYDVRPFAAVLGYLRGTPALEGHLNGPRRSLSRVRVPGRPGERITDRQDEPRELTVRLAVEGATPALARENWGKVYWIIRSKTPTELVFEDRPDRMLFAEYVGPADVAMLGTASLVQRHLPITIPFLLADPRWFATDETTVSGIQTAAVSLPQGEADIWSRMRIQGPTGAVILIELLNALTQVVASMELTVTPLTGSEFIVIDHERYTIHKNTTGNFGEGTRLLNAKTAGDWFPIRAIDSDPISGLTPFARVSSGTMDVVYRKAWPV